MTASEAKANQNRIVSSGFELGWWYGTGCRKCCGVYPKFMTKDTQNPRNAYYQCEVCGRRTDLYTMPWLAEKAWNNEFKEEKKMIKIEVETIEELFNIIGGGRPLTVSAPKAKSDPEKDALADENVKLANEVKKYKELLKLATDKADKLQAELDALKAAPVKAEDEANTYTFAGWTTVKGSAPEVVTDVQAGAVTYYATYTAVPKQTEPVPAEGTPEAAQPAPADPAAIFPALSCAYLVPSCVDTVGILFPAQISSSS